MKRKCAWCNTENEAERKICRECGLPVAKKLSLRDDMGSSGEESRQRGGTRWRALPVALGLLPLVAGLAIGGCFFWQRQEQSRAAQEEARQAQEQRAVQAQRKKDEEAMRQRVEEARRRIPESRPIHALKTVAVPRSVRRGKRSTNSSP